MIKCLFLLNHRIFLLLLLLSSSSSLFSENTTGLIPQEKPLPQEVLEDSFEEQAGNLFESILPYHKNPVFVIAGAGLAEDFNARIHNHTFTSLSYIKRSRYIFPGLGVKKVIFPFHVFL
ncbi:hypothetical protein JRG66_11420 [Salinimicrobium tongyeongense]|uniref:Uncharacterized protein n=1 Tax=Salinimicrobium tongyeongense TaxID=2809707 RepID=A0ABY6NP06_9FLAO|nr:hypothetical protein [Salinimicrobium tongyeongense]UZH54578.1 hypothetical protein JRG66_11420 [Salinimicrobium tongyeongense]